MAPNSVGAGLLAINRKPCVVHTNAIASKPAPTEIENLGNLELAC
jgi:hypothetical protein